MLSVKISHTQWAIPLEKVHYIDYVENLTPLPFTTSPIEGLTKFNNQPLVQVNLAQALGLADQSGSKRVIVTTSQGEVALRVDEVLDFIRPDLAEKSPLLLQLTAILAWVKTTNPIKAKPAITTPNNSKVTYLTALLVVGVLPCNNVSIYAILYVFSLHDCMEQYKDGSETNQTRRT